MSMGIWGRSRSISTLVVTVALAVGVSGCAGSPPGAGSASTAGTATATAAAPTARPVATATPTAAAPATPTAIPVAAGATCDTALTTAEYDKLAADGLTFRDDTANGNLDAVAEDGGIRCLWRVPSSDIEAWYAQWPSDQATWDALRAELVSGGATESAGAYPGVEQYEYNSALTYRDGTVYYASPARLFDSVLALQ